MMAPDKEPSWNQALQNMVVNDQTQRLMQTQTMVSVQHQDYHNQNAFISLQPTPQGITVYQPMVNTGIVVDFRQATSTPTNFPAMDQRYDTNNQICQVTNLNNAYNQILQTSPTSYASYPPPPRAYQNYIQGNNPLVINKQPNLPSNIAMNNQLTVINSSLLNQTPVMNHQPVTMTHQILTNQREAGHLINVQSNGFPQQNMTITRMSNPPTSVGVQQQANNILRKEGTIVTPTLAQLLDRGVAPGYPECNGTKVVEFGRPPDNKVVQNGNPIPQSMQNLNIPRGIQVTTRPADATEAASVSAPAPVVDAPPRKARLKISPRLGKDQKRKMWLSHFNPPKMEAIEEEEETATVPAERSLPEQDDNCQWDMSKFPKCFVKVTKLPREIEEIYFAKGDYKKKSNKPLVYVVPTNKQIIRFKPLQAPASERKVVAMDCEQKSSSDKHTAAPGDKKNAAATSVKKAAATAGDRKNATSNVKNSDRKIAVIPLAENAEVKVPKNAPLKTILKIKKVKKNEAYKVMENKKPGKELRTTIRTVKKYKIKRPNRRSEKSKCNFCGRMRKPADNWRHVMAIYSKNIDEKDQISKDQAKEECKKCETKVCSAAALKLHKQHVHGQTEETSYECFVCKKVLKTEEFLAFHLQTHYYNPKEDSKKTSKRTTESTDAESLNKCDVCQRTFQTGCALASHRKVHGILPSNRCSVCSKVFLKASHLKAHFVVHTDERPFACKECSKTFRFRSSLKQHTYSHLGIMPYKCKVCGKAFVANWSLSKHIKKAHKAPTEACTFCEQMFTDKLALNSHMKLYHGKKSPAKNKVTVKEDTDIEQLAESLLKQLADEDMEDSFGALTETDEPPTQQTREGKDDGAMEEGNDENECELCDAILTSVPELEKHLIYYHRVKDNKLAKLLPD